MGESAVYPGSLYDYNAGVHCGVLVTEMVMRKLTKLQQKHLEEVRRLLWDNKETDVFPSMWTLHYPGGEQTQVRFIDTSASLDDRIKLATRADQPRHKPLVFIASSMKEAEALADAHHETGRANHEQAS